MTKRKVLIMGAAGRDFHNFNVFYRDNEDYEVVAFTATQIPDIAGRKYPAELAGRLYPQGIPILPEEQMPEIIRDRGVDEVVFAYSDVAYPYVMRRAAIANAAGADFTMLGPNQVMLKPSKPLVAICAARTGCGKSQVSRKVFEMLSQKYKVAAIRHPMPYGDLVRQAVQRFASYDDLDDHHCTIEEREEYEPYIDMGGVVYAGVDYERILREAEKEADVIIWDGGNNDFAFYRPDLYITIVDPHRAGHELAYYPGEVNVRMADVVIVNKVDTADEKDIQQVENNVKLVNPHASIIRAESPVTIEDGSIRGKKTLVIEDGPTLTHGEMRYGAGIVAARQAGAEVIDPRPYATGSIKQAFKKYSHLENVLPALGYGKKQVKELEDTINRAEAEVVLSATPIDLRRVVNVNKPLVRVKYGVGSEAAKKLQQVLSDFEQRHL
ncbi:MAG TPA: GTPase [Thermoplasmatales archaeon]|mgnify:CR=1 FL=1|nr:cyclic 2,3-diphosphoglycerate synthase [Candidatus Thermoplasmatota archaeon]HDS59584.1 GTPase [Thermoplasmatales archaeon]